MTVGADDLVIRVRLDTTQAKQEIEKQDKAARKLGENVGGSMGRLSPLAMGLGGIASGLQLVFGPSIAASMSNLHTVAGNVGRASWVGQQIERDSSELAAKQRARQQTAEMFGMAGRVATPEQIMAIYNANLAMEMRDAKGRQKVEGVIDQAEAEKTIKAFNYLLNNLGQVLSHFIGGWGNTGKPEIK